MPHTYRGEGGGISLFCLMWGRQQKDNKYNSIGLELKAPHGTE